MRFWLDVVGHPADEQQDEGVQDGWFSDQNRGTRRKLTGKNEVLVSHYSAIGDTISCDAPYSAIGFRGQLILRYPPC